MAHSVPFEFQKAAVRKKSDSGKTIYTAIASTDALDRDKEVLLPRGVITDQFMKNPVMLFIHNYRQVPVGRVLDMKVDNSKISFHFEFADTELGKELEKLYITNFMNAFSVGFYPKAYKFIDEETPDQLELEVADGSKQAIDLTKYSTRPSGIVSKWELLEISPVPVPSNPEALLIRAKEEIVRKYITAHPNHKSAVQLLEEQLNDQVKELADTLTSFMQGLEGGAEVKLHSAVPVHKTAVVKEEGQWDVTRACASLARWASEDGSGDKAKINWGRYAKGFGWVDTEKSQNLSSYKFAHHYVKDGELVAVWSGVTTAMATLLTMREWPGAQEIYDHLAAHYRDAGHEPPAFDREYTAEEVRAIGEGKAVSEAKAEQQEQSTGGNEQQEGEKKEELDLSGLKTVVDAGFKQTKDVLSEMEETVRVRMNILVDLLGETQQQIKDLAQRLEQGDGTDTGDAGGESGDGDKDFEGQLLHLSDMLKDLRQPNTQAQ